MWWASEVIPAATRYDVRTQPIWSFSETAPRGTATVSIGFSRKMPSSVVLPVVPGVAAQSPLPACPSLRNEPCRAYVAISNRAGRLGQQRRRATNRRTLRQPTFTG